MANSFFSAVVMASLLAGCSLIPSPSGEIAPTFSASVNATAMPTRILSEKRCRVADAAGRRPAGTSTTLNWWASD